MDCPKCKRPGAMESAIQLDTTALHSEMKTYRAVLTGVTCVKCGPLNVLPCCNRWAFSGHAAHCVTNRAHTLADLDD